MPEFRLKSKIIIQTLLVLLWLCHSTFWGWGQTPIPETPFQTENEAREQTKQWGGESFRRSVVLYLKASGQWAGKGELEKSSACLREASRLLSILAENEEAEIQLIKALQIDVSHNLKDERIVNLSQLSQVYLKAGKTVESKKKYQEALELSNQTDNPEVLANAFFSAGLYNYSFGQVDKTIAFFQKALTYAEKAEEKNLIAQSYQYLGFTYIRNGNPALALEEITKALGKCVETGNKRNEAIINIGLGFAYSQMDEKQKALFYYQQANAMFPGDVDWMEQAKSYNGIATIYEEYGEMTFAETCREKALELYQKADYSYGRLATLPSLAKLKYLTGKKDLSKKLFDEALVLAAKLKDSFHPAVINEELGNLELTDQNYEASIVYYQKALKVYQTLNIKLPRIENNLGLAFEKKGDLAAARQHFETALKTNRQIRDMVQVSQNLYYLADLENLENHPENALNFSKESVEITETLYSNVLNSQLKSSYFSNAFDRYEFYIHLLMNRHRASPNENFAIRALQTAEQSRARAMQENLSLSEADFTKDADAETISREKQIRVLLNAKADILTDLLNQNTDQTEIEKVDGEINQLQNELEEIKGQLKQKSPLYSAIKNPAPFDVVEFQQNILDENSLLLEFSFGRKESYLWLVSKNEVCSYVLPPREIIETHIENLRKLLDSREMRSGENIEDFQNRIAGADVEYQTEAAQLSQILFGQIADKISDKRLIIVADGKLHYFPVAALPLPNSTTNEPILLTNETIYEPSAQTLRLFARTNQAANSVKNLLVFSDPVFTRDDSRFSAENKTVENADTELSAADKFRFVESLNTLPRLTASKDEADSISKIIGASTTDIFSGFSANRSQLLNAGVNNYKIIHFATHGLINEQRPELSGIVFSRFDKNGQKIEETLRIHDIYGLNLNADLVVLSACQTGLGKEVRGEGLQSLNNAFLQTGAKSVVASLWKVEDHATLELMKNFYSEMASERIAPAQALRLAQIKLRQNPQYQSPFYWAAFTAQGDFRHPLSISKGAGKWVYPALIAMFLLFGFYFLKKFQRK